MRSSMMGFFSSHSVSPVMTSFRPATAMMSPVLATLMSSRLLACIISRRPMRSFFPLLAQRAYVPASRTPLQHPAWRQLAALGQEYVLIEDLGWSQRLTAHPELLMLTPALHVHTQACKQHDQEHDGSLVHSSNHHTGLECWQPGDDGSMSHL